MSTLDKWQLGLSILGSITGIVAIVFSYLNYNQTKANLKINIVKGREPWFITTEDVHPFGGYDCQVLGYIPIVLVNKSNQPITITDIYIKISDKKFIQHDPEVEIERKYIEYKINSFTKYYEELFQALSLPLIINPYESQISSLRFPFLDNLYQQNTSNVNLNIVIETSRKDYTLKVQLIELKQYQSVRYPQCIDKVG